MKEFKHPKAIEMIKQAQELECFMDKCLSYDSLLSSQYGQIRSKIAHTKELAKNIEAGVITPEELKDA